MSVLMLAAITVIVLIGGTAAGYAMCGNKQGAAGGLAFACIIMAYFMVIFSLE